jgi:hypothetical protein
VVAATSFQGGEPMRLDLPTSAQKRVDYSLGSLIGAQGLNRTAQRLLGIVEEFYLACA